MKRKIPLYLVPTAMLCAALVPCAAYAVQPGGGNGHNPNTSQEDAAESESFEYISITVQTRDGVSIGSLYDRGDAGADGWLIQGTYNTPSFTMTQGANKIHYVVGNQSGDVPFILPEGYEVGDWTPTYTISDASINSQSSQFDCCIATITINTIVNSTTGEEIPYTYYGVTIEYQDITDPDNLLDIVTISEYDLAGSDYNLTEYDKKPFEGYEYVKTEGDSLTGTLNDNLRIVVYYTPKTTEVVPEEPDNPVVPEEKQYTVDYEWSGDAPEGVDLPESAKYKEGSTCKATELENGIIETEDGTWVFLGWDKNGEFEVTEDTTIIGTWKFLSNEVDPDSKPSVIPPTSTDDDEEVDGTAVEDETEVKELTKAENILPQTGDSTPLAVGLLGMIVAMCAAITSRFKMNGAM